MGVARLDGRILALTRSGYLARTSRWPQHYFFADWVDCNQHRFLDTLEEGERLAGEWLMQAPVPATLCGTIRSSSLI